MYADDLGRACVFLMQNYDAEEFINVGYGSDVEFTMKGMERVDAVLRQLAA